MSLQVCEVVLIHDRDKTGHYGTLYLWGAFSSHGALGFPCWCSGLFSAFVTLELGGEQSFTWSHLADALIQSALQ